VLNAPADKKTKLIGILTSFNGSPNTRPDYDEEQGVFPGSFGGNRFSSNPLGDEAVCL